tara:strand:+ start:184 stop:426 length:243 start_codon:yes stop_codon:yes gene_type:complete
MYRKEQVASPISVEEGIPPASQFHLNTQRFPIRSNDRKSSNDVYRNKPKTTPKTMRTKINLKKPHAVPSAQVTIDSENVE